MTTKIKRIYGANPGEAWTNVEICDEASMVCTPSEDAVKLAKNWVDENQK
jgi:hypothetical protein